jgi:hypothetical protein
MLVINKIIDDGKTKFKNNLILFQYFFSDMLLKATQSNRRDRRNQLDITQYPDFRI